MIFKLKQEKNKLLEKAYNNGLKKLNSFFNQDFKKGKIEVFIIKDRKMINLLLGRKTASWVVGWVNGTAVYLLDRKNFQKESSHHKYSEKEYSALLVHEMCHVFYRFVPGNPKPSWLNEGISVFLSGQNRFKKTPKKLSKFLKSYDKTEEGVYDESGFFIELLIKKFGKKKLFELIKSAQNCKNQKLFSVAFRRIYKFNLTYNEINKLYNKK